MISSTISINFVIIPLAILALSHFWGVDAFFGAPQYKSLFKFEDAPGADEFWALDDVPSAVPAKRNFYTHFWRNIAQRMPSYRGGRRVQAVAENPMELDVIEKRSPWLDRQNAIRNG